LPHPHIVHYYGCRIKRGRITAILFEKLEKNLTKYIHTPEFQHLDKKKFMEALESAIEHLHSLGLAHNDLNPNNIMVRNGLPVLVDFGSAGMFGESLYSTCTVEWYPESVTTSEKKHDVECLAKLREWIEKPMGFGAADGSITE
jgi:serine/threonine protein kinase